ncbi:MAG: hypothetical protein JJ866_27410 [Roseibium sp.]|nr:hypothetical protein [Roseibium sp.]
MATAEDQSPDPARGMPNMANLGIPADGITDEVIDVALELFRDVFGIQSVPVPDHPKAVVGCFR